MKSDIKFFYNQEFWYISAFLNSKEVNEKNIAKEIEILLKERLKNLKEDEFPYLDNFPDAQEKKRKLVEMVNNVFLECSWVPCFKGFSYIAEKKDFTHDNKPLILDSLGYFKFNIEYYKNDITNQNEKETIEPILIQQIPIKARDIIKEFCGKIENEYLLMDCESYIYDFVTSNKVKPTEIPWTTENIKKYKQILGYWIEIYSGSWEDYSEELFDKRIENNLSNRVSELHYLRRNSGFIYMVEDNYRKHFDFYMIENVLEPTAKVRAMQYALMSINESLDILFMKRYSMFMSLERLEEKIDQLRFLKGTIQTNLSLIYNEMDWNRRQHHTKVLTHLLNEFKLEEIVERLEKKFDLLHDSLEKLYSTKREQQDKVRERLLTFLSFLFGLGIIADITTLTMNAFALELGHPLTFFLNIIMLGIIISGFIVYLLYYRANSLEET